METDNQQADIRREKLDSLKGRGIDPYPSCGDPGTDTSEALKLDDGQQVRISGRIMSRRLMGKAAFAHLQDSAGRMQVYIRKDKAGEDVLGLFKELDLGDFIGVEGEVFTTRTGEKTVMVSKMDFLSKALRPMPEKWHGLRDKELRYRKRYLDTLVNAESSEFLRARSRIIGSIRNLLEEKGFAEVETPILQNIPGGAAARPFTTHHNVYDTGLYLRIAPELYLKRLLVGGWDRVFEIGRNFRNEGVSTRHNPEFTMLEVYRSYTDYTYMMDLSREIILSAAAKLGEGFTPAVDVSSGWKKENLWELIRKHTGVEFSPEDSLEELKKKAASLDVPPGKDSAAKVVDRVFSAHVQDKLIEPVFVTGYPAKDSPLAKSSPDNGIFAERFELYINGQEIGNAYTEQNDPLIQREMFEAQAGEKSREGIPSGVDEEYLEALEHGMPPASGLGIGIDRLVMVLTGAESIREVILFPMLRPEG